LHIKFSGVEEILNHTSLVIIIAGLWNTANGLLHDIFVLRSEHAKQYDRNLLRLLMDGHILMTCGIILLVVRGGIGAAHNYAYYVGFAALASILVYCFLIFPFLKSIGTILINSFSLVILLISFIKK